MLFTTYKVNYITTFYSIQQFTVRLIVAIVIFKIRNNKLCD